MIGGWGKSASIDGREARVVAGDRVKSLQQVGAFRGFCLPQRRVEEMGSACRFVGSSSFSPLGRGKMRGVSASEGHGKE